MQIHRINAAVYQRTSANYNIKNNINPINVEPKDTVSFSGKHFPVKQLDKYIDTLYTYRNTNIAREEALNALTPKLNETLETINQKISPLLEDKSFLWEITPNKTKQQYSSFAIRSAYNGNGTYYNAEAWNTIYASIRSHILAEHPSIITKELAETSQSITTLYKENHLELSKLINSKTNAYKIYENKRLEINSDYAQKHLDIDSELIKQEQKIRGNHDKNTFFREVVHRATERKPELKEVYKQEYKRYFGYITEQPSIKRGKAMQQASDYANIQTLLYVKHGNLEDIPF